MSDETGATETQADSGTQPPAGTASTQADGADGEATQPETISLEEAKKLRSEANSLRKRLKAFEDADKARTDADLSETEKLTKRISELEAERTQLLAREQERTVHLSAVEAATRLGFRSPELAFRLVDQSAIEYREDGTPKNVERLLKELLEREPYLARATTPDYGGGNRGVTPVKPDNVNDLLRAAVRGRT